MSMVYDIGKAYIIIDPILKLYSIMQVRQCGFWPKCLTFGMFTNLPAFIESLINKSELNIIKSYFLNVNI